jgi:hypothetical protein
MYYKEKTMKHWFVSTVSLTTLLGVGLVSQTMAAGNDSKKVPRDALPRIVATVTTLGPRGMATITTADGATYEVITGTSWWLGDTVECEQTDRQGIPKWEALNCRKAS